MDIIEFIKSNRDYFEDFITRSTYHSNRIEGNTLSYVETYAILFNANQFQVRGEPREFFAADALIGFCQGIQAASPVDSYAAPEPSPEPGYTDEVVMASGSFTQGSTIELSCDGPLREPYTCYLQGGLNFAASRAGVLLAVQNAYFKD